MSKRKSRRNKIGRSILARYVVICIVAVFIGSFGVAVPALAAQQAEDAVKVSVNAPAYVEETFTATIDVGSITDFNSAQFDLSFDPDVIEVSDVEEGKINGEDVPIVKMQDASQTCILYPAQERKTKYTPCKEV